MSSKTKVRTLRLPKDLDDYIGRVSADTGKSLTEVLTEGVLMHRAGGAAGFGPAESGSKIDAKLDVVLEVMKLHADQLNLLNSKVEGIERQAPIIDSTHRYVAGLNKSVGVMFRNLENLLRELGFEPVSRKAEDGGNGGEGDDGRNAGGYRGVDEVDSSAATSAASEAEVEPRAPQSAAAPAKTKVTLTAEQVHWLNSHGKRLGLVRSEDAFEARLRALRESGKPLPPVPSGLRGVSNIVGCLEYLLVYDTERLDAVLGLSAETKAPKAKSAATAGSKGRLLLKKAKQPA